MRNAYALFKLGVASLFCFALSGFLIKIAYHDAPREGPPLGELAPAIGAGFVGLALAALIVLAIFVQMRSRPKDAEMQEREWEKY